MTNTEESTTIEICIDCLMWHANGEISDETPEREAEIRAQAGLEEGQYITLGIMASEHYADCENVDHETEEWIGGAECECEQVTFSRNRCGACHSRLGGARERCTLWFQA